MRSPRRSRRLLSGDELRLWGEIAKLVTPLRGKAVPTKMMGTKMSPAKVPPNTTPPTKARSVTAPAAEPARQPVTDAPATPKPTPSALPGVRQKRPVKLADLLLRASAPQGPSVPAPAAPAFRPAPPLSAGLERKERRGLQRGTLEIEARIDLHGLYQAEAHAALVGFIARARAAGHARVLVVTGKGGEIGGEAGAGFGDARGVLRRSVPHWLRGPDLRGLVVGFEEAGRRHGGGGALYVRLRRR